jgi:hypothetical protein
MAGGIAYRPREPKPAPVEDAAAEPAAEHTAEPAAPADPVVEPQDDAPPAPASPDDQED